MFRTLQWNSYPYSWAYPPRPEYGMLHYGGIPKSCTNLRVRAAINPCASIHASCTTILLMSTLVSNASMSLINLLKWSRIEQTTKRKVLISQDWKLAYARKDCWEVGENSFRLAGAPRWRSRRTERMPRGPEDALDVWSPAQQIPRRQHQWRDKHQSHSVRQSSGAQMDACLCLALGSYPVRA